MDDSATSSRTLDQLVNTPEPAWPDVASWLTHAINAAEVLPRRLEDAEASLLYLQVTTRSALGAVAYETGGILFDHGWLRFLGAGSERMQGNLRTWGAEAQ